jgi:ElaB/YqjD/DUF883 family membrane-anchored ribosome-binding protein
MPVAARLSRYADEEMDGMPSLKPDFRRIHDLHQIGAVRVSRFPAGVALHLQASIARRARAVRARRARQFRTSICLMHVNGFGATCPMIGRSRWRDIIMKSETVPAAGGGESLKQGIEQVKDAAEALLRSTADETRDGWHGARATLGGKARTLRSDVSGRARDLAEDARDLGDKGQRLMREYPRVAIGIGAGLGLLAGLLIRRR